jgi:hypothetical protein
MESDSPEVADAFGETYNQLIDKLRKDITFFVEDDVDLLTVEEFIDTSNEVLRLSRSHRFHISDLLSSIDVFRSCCERLVQQETNLPEASQHLEALNHLHRAFRQEYFILTSVANCRIRLLSFLRHPDIRVN